MKPCRLFLLKTLCLNILVFLALPVWAQATTPSKQKPCLSADVGCIHTYIAQTAQTLTNKTERDQTYRELAKSWTKSGNPDSALKLVPLIETPDTRAMTIRGIGMELAGLSLPKPEQDRVFLELRTQAENLKTLHPPSYAIALTYIAMAQAFAGDDEGAWKTAGDMENAALRHKAFGETAEIQAEKRNYDKAKISLNKIDDLPYKNKAYVTISRILVQHNLMNEAYDAAIQISNPFLKASALQNLVDVQIEQKRKAAETSKAVEQ